MDTELLKKLGLDKLSHGFNLGSFYQPGSQAQQSLDQQQKTGADTIQKVGVPLAQAGMRTLKSFPSATTQQIQNAPIGKIIKGDILGGIKQSLAQVGPQLNTPEGIMGFVGGGEGLTTKTLERLMGKNFVSKQFIQDLTNMPDLKQAEKDIIRNILKNHTENVNVKDFTDQVKNELLPLKRLGETMSGGRYESISLPSDLRGNVANYQERVYQSPIKTSAGDLHFSNISNNENYFAHTRIEDVAPNAVPGSLEAARKAGISGEELSKHSGNTRRVIEIQSDLFQKGRMEDSVGQFGGDPRKYLKTTLDFNKSEGIQTNPKFIKDWEEKIAEYEKNLKQLEPYRNIWHERVIREEVKQAAKDGKTKLQFPTGETAMKIEGLGQTSARWRIGEWHPTIGELKPESLKVGLEISDHSGPSGKYIVTNVLGDGKFKALAKSNIPPTMRAYFEGSNLTKTLKEGLPKELDSFTEQFDISGKVDQNNPIYRFYEKEVGRYLKNKYNAQLVTDPQGVKWWELDVPKDKDKVPVEAFAVVPSLLTVKKKEQK